MTKLASSFTTFLKAFRASDNFISDIASSRKWVRSKIVPDKAYLLNHVYEFFAHNSEYDGLDKNQAVLYELRTELETEEQKNAIYPYSSFFSRRHFIDFEAENIGFSIERGNNILAPIMIYVPLTQIVILALTVRLQDKDQQLNKLIYLNYHLRVSSKGALTEISTERKSHPKAHESEEKILNSLDNIEGFRAEEDSFLWNINTLSGYLMKEMETSVEDLSPARLQAFTYVNMQDDLSDSEFESAFFRLRRVYSNRYVPAAAFIENNSETSQTFEKVYYGASVEGAVVLVKPDEGVFLKNYESTVIQRTIWSYLLAFHQRMALISAAHETNSLFRDNRDPATSELSFLIDKLAKLQLKCLFEEVSHYSQQNEFYYLALHNLKVSNLFREVKEEVDEVNIILTEKWREQEVKERESREEGNRKNQRKIEVLLALLIIPQIWFAILSTNVEEWVLFVNKNKPLVNSINLLIWVLIAGGLTRLFLLSKRRRKYD